MQPARTAATPQPQPSTGAQTCVLLEPPGGCPGSECVFWAADGCRLSVLGLSLGAMPAASHPLLAHWRIQADAPVPRRLRPAPALQDAGDGYRVTAVDAARTGRRAALTVLG